MVIETILLLLILMGFGYILGRPSRDSHCKTLMSIEFMVIRNLLSIVDLILYLFININVL